MADHHTHDGTTRRGLLRAGGLGLGAAFLASCAKEITPGGVSGTPASSTSTPATVPRKLPSQVALADDATELRTAASVELLIADVYTDYGPKLTDPAFVDHAARFAEAHAAAAETYLTALEEAEATTGITDSEPVEPNPYLLENFVAPAEQGLVDDVSILNFMRASEATIAANAINAVGVFSRASSRQLAMSFGAAATRRVTVLDNAGQGSVPAGALFPLTDLMPNDAFLTGETTTTTAAPDAAGEVTTTTVAG